MQCSHVLAGVMNHDECPQAICYGGGKGACRAKVGIIPGQKAVTTVCENREQVTMHPTVDLNADWGPSLRTHSASDKNYRKSPSPP